MKKKILIIGKNSFLGGHLFAYLKKHFNVSKISYEKFNTLSLNLIKKHTHIINCAIHPKYQTKVYEAKYDIDVKISKKIKDTNLKYIFFSTRKVYREKFNIKETSTIETKCNYSKNKIKSEKKLFLLLKKNLIVLRISNILGLNDNLHTKRKVHKLFLDNYLDFVKKNKKLNFDNGFKDFITVNQFCSIIRKIINSKIHGTYNLSLGKKIYLKEIIEWLGKSKSTKIIINKKVDIKNSFTLSNKKLFSKLNINLEKQSVKNFCNKISKNIYK